MKARNDPVGLLSGLPPVADARARVLILGSMPGEQSLAAGQYYAHPRNAFWPIMGAMVGAGLDLPYQDRLMRLQAAGIALWDVIRTCRRTGSLDTAICEETPNDIRGLLSRCPHIQVLFFNGSKAESTFRRCVLPGLAGRCPGLTRLPSTSPAHAGRSRDSKLAAWSRIGDFL